MQRFSQWLVTENHVLCINYDLLVTEEASKVHKEVGSSPYCTYIGLLEATHALRLFLVGGELGLMEG